jgi:Coenzyme PQQ synthesis protein D (PqqD)
VKAIPKTLKWTRPLTSSYQAPRSPPLLSEAVPSESSVRYRTPTRYASIGPGTGRWYFGTNSGVRYNRYGRVWSMKRAVSERSTVVAAKGQVSSDLGGEVAILDLDAGMYYGLEEVGARIWELVQEPRLVEEIQATILKEYEVDPARGRHDVLALLQELVDKGLVEVRDEAPA